jgi:spore germination cell wall hydrolase CwlJ-like protein
MSKTGLFIVAAIVLVLFWGSQRREVIDERDYLIRTIVFEASGETEIGKIAVAYAVLNRKKSPKWGDNIKAVVTQPGQFEPWMTRRKEIEQLSPDDPRYRSAAKIADAVLSGETPDPTAGATHFLNSVIVRERRGGTLPSWARGEGRPIGRHTFYSPHERKASPQQATLALGAR